LTGCASGRYAGGVKRLELVRVRVCRRCGRGTAELQGDDGRNIAVRLDPERARELSDAGEPDGVGSLTDLVLARLPAGGLPFREVVLDVAGGHLRALVSVGDGEPEVVGCTAEEGVALAVRGGLALYATDEALAHGAAGTQGPHGAHGLH